MNGIQTWLQCNRLQLVSNFDCTFKAIIIENASLDMSHDDLENNIQNLYEVTTFWCQKNAFISFDLSSSFFDNIKP